jgi:hypothetical protein
MVHTIPPKEDKVGTSLMEAPMAQVLVAQPGSKVPDDNLADDDPDLLNFDMTEFDIVCWGSPGCRFTGLTYGNRTIQFGILDDLVFVPPDVGPAFLVLGHEDVEGGLWASLRLAPLFFCHWSSLGLFSLIILSGRSSPIMTSLPLVDSPWDGQTRTFFPSSLTMFMFARNESMSSFIWGFFANFNHPSFMAD